MEHALRTRRVEMNLSVEALADRVGVAKSTISRIETWQADPSLSLIMKLCKQFPGLTPNDFVASAANEAAQ